MSPCGRVSAGTAHNLIGPGVRGGLTLIPLSTWATPTLSITVGRTHDEAVEKLEALATAYKGVQKAYAIQAGREIRVIVRQEDITDTESFQLSRDLAKKIEQELTYPGQIRVTVIRESRYVEYAK